MIVNGNLTLDGTFNATALSGFDQGTFVLIDYNGTLTDDGLDLGSLPGGFSYQLVNDAADTQIDLVVSAVGVPEPATWLLLGTGSILGGGTGYTCWRRQRRRRITRPASPPPPPSTPHPLPPPANPAAPAPDGIGHTGPPHSREFLLPLLLSEEGPGEFSED